MRFDWTNMAGARHKAAMALAAVLASSLLVLNPANAGSVNRIDASALSSLETINDRLKSAGVNLHFSELHTHIKEGLKQSSLMEHLTGEIFFTQQEAIEALEPDPDWSQFSDHVDIH